MLRKFFEVLRSPDAHPAQTGGENGAGSPPADPRGVLAALFASQNSPASPENQESAPSAAPADPEVQPQTETAEHTGQDLPPEETPQAEGEPAAEGEPENQDPEAATEGQEPNRSPNVQKRIDALTAKNTKLAQEKAELEARVQELETAGGSVPTGPAAEGLPPDVAKLKSVAEVQARQQLAKQNAKELQRYLNAHSGEPETVYQIGDKEVTRQELVDSLENWTNELEALPQRRDQLEREAQFAATRSQARKEMLTRFPYLADEAHATTQAVRQKLAEAPFLKSFAAPEYAALVWVAGEKALAAEMAARTGKPAVAAARPAGTVPVKKPMTAGGASTRGDGSGLKAALEQHGKNGSRGSFADLLASRPAVAGS